MSTSKNIDLLSRVVDPYLFFRIRIQSLMLETNTGQDPDPIRIQGFNDQQLKKKNTAENFFIFFFYQKLQFTYP